MPANYVDPYFKELFGGKTPQQVASEITSLMPAAMADIDPAFNKDYAPYTSKESIEKVVNTVASTPGATKKLFNYQTFGATNRDIPYLSGMGFGDEYGKPMVDYGLMTNVANEINKTGEKQFVLNNLPAIVVGYSEGYGGNLKDFVDSFPSLGFTQADMPAIEKGYNQGLKEQAYVKSISTPFTIKHGFGSMVSGALKTAQPILSNPIVQIAMAYYMPGIASSFAPSLGAFGITGAAQTAVANAIASTAVQVAQGVPLDKALQTAVTNAVVSSGSPEIAKDINRVIQNPAVTDAIVSAGASAAKTALNGGSQADIERNLAAGLVGSGTASATGSNIAGSAAGGAVTGGVTGALTGAAGAYGAQVEADRIAKEKAAKEKTTASGFVSGINLASTDTGTVSDAGGVSVGVSGTPIFADSPRATSVKAPFGFAVMPIEMADNKPTGAYYDYTQNAWIAPIADIQKFTTISTISSADPNAGRSSIAPGVDLTQPTTPSSSYEPTIITTGGTTFSTGRKTPTINGQTGKSNVGLTGGSSKKVTGPGTGSGTGTGKGTPTGGGPETSPSNVLDTVYVTAEGEPELIDQSFVDETQKELPPVEDKTGTPVDEQGRYRPSLFIYGGTKPSTLSQSLGTTVERIPTSSTTTGTSVGLGGRGEIESKESGKKRKNVWNEESLRLKDALGL